MTRAPALWFAAFVSFDAIASRLLPPGSASYDFTANGAIVGHITDRALTPLPVVQNTPAAWPLWIAFALAFSITYAAYERLCRSQPSTRTLWLALALGGGAMLFVPYLPTSDPYAYALYGLEAGPLHLDPYVSQAFVTERSPWAAALLSIFPSAHDYVRVCNYGPVFVAVYAALALPLAHLPLIFYLLAERALGLACLVFIAGTLVRANARSAAARFVLNPLVLFEFVAFAHGDALMFALLAAAYVAWKRERCAAAGAFCVLAIGVRSVALLALLALGLFVVRRRPRAAAATAATVAIASVLAYALARWSFGEVALGGAPRFNAFSSPALALSSALGLSDWILVGVGAGAIGGLCLLALLTRRWWSDPAGDALAWSPWAALVAAPSIFPHYLAWPLAGAALNQSERLRRVANVAAALAPLLYLTHMNLFAPPGPPPAGYVAVLALFWGAVIASLAVRAPNAVPAPPARALPDGC